MTKYLLDASALYPLILRLREKMVLFVDRFVILDLTLYEVGNIVWKEYHRGRIRDPVLVATMFREVLRNVRELSIECSLPEIVELSVKNNITFYDASYIYVARRHGLRLVTEDVDLKKFPEAISVDKLLRELGV